MTALDEAKAKALEAFTAAGLLVDELIADGTRHRCAVDGGKPGAVDGCYILHPDPPYSWWFQNHKTGATGSGSLKTGTTMTKAERQAARREQEANRRQRAADEAKIHAAAASRARRIYEGAADCPGHVYLTAKGVLPSPGLRLTRAVMTIAGASFPADSLIVPLYDAAALLSEPDGKPVAPGNLQFISATGDKRYLPGGQKQGGGFVIGDVSNNEPLLVCEGLATGLTLHAAAGFPIFVAFDAGNLQAVAAALRRQYPDRQIVLAADDDWKTPGNPGLSKATAAARAIGGCVAVPAFGPERGQKDSDFNDQAAREGIEAVRLCVEAAIKKGPLPGKEAAPQNKTHGATMPQDSDEGNPKTAKKSKTGGKSPGAPSPTMPPGFSNDDAGLFASEYDKGSKSTVQIRIGDRLDIVGLTRDASGDSYGLLLRWRDSDARPRTWAMPMRLLIGHEPGAWLGELVDKGWRFVHDRKNVDHLKTYLAISNPDRRALCVTSTGWHGRAFVLPGDEILYPGGEPGKELIVLQTESAENPYATGGTADGWRQTIGAWAAGNSRLAFAVSVALAAPLLGLLKIGGCGFNIQGDGSSIGKTTGLLIAASVCGKGTESGGFLTSWDTTGAALEENAMLHNDTVLILDEMSRADPEVIGKSAYMLAGGQGKDRSQAAGGLRARRQWRTLFLSSGELSLEQELAKKNLRLQGGQTVRLIDIPADAGQGFGLFENLHGFRDGKSFADALQEAAKVNYGYALRQWVRALTDNQAILAWIKARMKARPNPLLPQEGASSQLYRVADYFLLCALAGEEAAKAGVVPWPPGEATWAAKTCFNDWIARRRGGSLEDAEDLAILKYYDRFMTLHGNSRFQDVDDEEGAAKVINRVGYRRDGKADKLAAFISDPDAPKPGQTEFWVTPTMFAAEIFQGYDAERAIKVLRQHGRLKPGEGRHMKRKVPNNILNLDNWPGGRGYCLLMGGAVATDEEAGS